MIKVIQHHNEARTNNIQYQYFSYNGEKGTVLSKDDFLARLQDTDKKWINIKNGRNNTLYHELAEHFTLNSLIEVDLRENDLRPKIQDFNDHIEIVLQVPRHQESPHRILLEQIIIILKKNMIITIQHSDHNVFESFEKEISTTPTKLHREGVDYLAAVLIDHVIDQYYIVSEHLTEKLDGLEDDIIKNPSKQTIQNLYHYKKEIMQLVHTIWPLREVVSVLEREKSDLVGENTYFYFRNILENVFQVIDTITFMRDMSSEMMDIYLSSINNRINDVMKVLTVITTIFMPLSFIASYYGMNFKYMPELEWGYPGVFVIMLFILLGMIFFFKKKRWL